jgi:uncharacterized peroxidase-related enzyme
MVFIRTIPPEQATGTLHELYERERAAGGHRVSVIELWSLRPEVLAAWQTLFGAIRAPMDTRRFELVTVVAAAGVRCTVCTVQHGAALHANAFTVDHVAALAAGNYGAAGLSPAEEAIAAFAERVVSRSDELTQADVDRLRAHGLEDTEIFDVVLAATARIFFSRTCDAIGYEPPDWWVERSVSLFGEEVFQALTVGRPIRREGMAAIE